MFFTLPRIIYSKYKHFINEKCLHSTVILIHWLLIDLLTNIFSRSNGGSYISAQTIPPRTNLWESRPGGVADVVKNLTRKPEIPPSPAPVSLQASGSSPVN